MAVGWAVTVPYGRLPYSSWRCTQCPASSTSYTAADSEADAAARRHVAEAGHEVEMIQGTCLTLAPLALEVPG